MRCCGIAKNGYYSRHPRGQDHEEQEEDRLHVLDDHYPPLHHDDCDRWRGLYAI